VAAIDRAETPNGPRKRRRSRTTAAVLGADLGLDRSERGLHGGQRVDGRSDLGLHVADLSFYIDDASSGIGSTSNSVISLRGDYSQPGARIRKVAPCRYAEVLRVPRERVRP
jgi:hypothetical protein